MPYEKDLHVLIIGGGLAGLSLAHGLNKNGINSTIYDRETQPRDRNWGITLSWSLPLLQALLPASLFDILQQCQPDPSLAAEVAGREGVLVRDGATGKEKIRMHFPVIRRVNIQKTKRLLATGLDIKYGKKLINISTTPEKVTAYFEDGTQAVGDVIIGADGGNSKVRKWLLGDIAKQEVLPFTFMNFAFSLPAERASWVDKVMNHNVDVATHPKSMYLGLFMLDKPDLEKPETWVFYVLVTWPEDSEKDEDRSGKRLDRLRGMMDGWADPYRSIVGWLDDDIVIKPDQLRIWHPKPWDNRGGRVTLAGDAAHSMTFHRGQGGNLAIKDAFELVNKLVAVKEGDLGLKEAMDEYDTGVLERGEEVEISKKQAFAFHDYENFDTSPVFKMGINPNAK